MFSSKYGKCQSGSISAMPSAEMNRVEMSFAMAVILSESVVSLGRPGGSPNLIAPKLTARASPPRSAARAGGGEVRPRVGQRAQVVEQALLVAVVGAHPDDRVAARALGAGEQLGEACERSGTGGGGGGGGHDGSPILRWVLRYPFTVAP